MVSFTGLGAAAAVVSAVIAGLQARGAKASKREATAARDQSRNARDESVRLAAEANSAFMRQAAAQEEANELKRREILDWSFWAVGPRTWRVVNTSQRIIVDAKFHVRPEAAAPNVVLGSTQKDGRFEAGDSFIVQFLGRMEVQPEKLLVQYRFEDDPRGDYRVWFLAA